MELGIHGVNSIATQLAGMSEGAFPDGLLLDDRPARGWEARQFDPGTLGAEPASGVVSRYLIS